MTSLASSSSRNLILLSVLLVATSLLCLALSCAAPMAALAAVAALALSRNETMGFMFAAWGISQLVGFVWLNYPQDSFTLLWGAVLGVAALSAGLSAHLARRYGAAATWLAAVAGYQFVLLLANLTPLGGLDSFALSIKAPIIATELAAFMVLSGAYKAAYKLADKRGIVAA